MDTNDMKFHHPNGFVTSDEFVAYVTDAIDALVEEGRRGSPKLLNIGYHLRIAGRPARIATLTRVLEYLESLGDEVWVARRDEIARFWRERYRSSGAAQP
jgi:hypothetical protein